MSIKKGFYQAVLSWFILVSFTSCIDPYEPEVKNIPESFMVVDGFINSTGISTIKLSRTINLSADTFPAAVYVQNIFIEGEEGSQYPLEMQEVGTYSSGILTLNPAGKYRLHFRTGEGKEYVSDYQKVKITPAIDKVTWQAKDDELQVYVSTHDETNSTQYYRWKYEETWEFTSAYQTPYEYNNKKIVQRKDDIYRCWRTEVSSGIKISSTARLSQDVVSDFPMLKVPANSVKLALGYSVLVKQYALSQEEYVYYETLRKNTESIGTLFDPLPTQLTGNVHCLTNATEPVIGYVGVRSETEKRMLVLKEELPVSWAPRNTGYENCYPIDTAQVDGMTFRSMDQVVSFFSGGNVIPVSPIMPANGPPKLVGYTYSTVGCVDCRLQGTNIKPDYWK